MKDPTFELRKAYKTLLTTAVPTVTVYDAIVANDAPKKRILLSAQTYVEQGDKDNYAGIATIDLEVIAVYPLGSGGGKWSDETASIISQAVSPQKGICGLSVTGWNVLTASLVVVPFPPIPEGDSGDYVHRKILRFSHLVYQT